MNLGVDGQVFLIMGGSRGLGRATAEALLGEGARVVITSRTRENAEQACQDLSRDRDRAIPLALDTEHPDSMAGLGARLDQLVPGGLAGAYINTGGPPAGDFGDLGQEQWQLAAQKLILGPVEAVRQVLPRLGAGGSLLFNTSSSIRTPIPHLLLSNALRPAVVALAKSLSLELAPKGIRVNVIAPGRIATDRVADLDQVAARREAKTVDEIRRRSQDNIPLGRYGEPSEYGQVAAFLLSQRASYVTGITLLVDGGVVRSL